METPGDKPGSWATLPHKSQLIVLALCRFAEPLSNLSVLSYLYYLLQSFDQSLTPAEISREAGFVVTSFALGQFLSGAIWGSLSDTIGRKAVLMIGLSGTILSTLMFGFSDRLWHVMAARLLAGLLNGNVGVLRTMISEVVVEKKHQSRAFLIMPMCFNIGAIIGPIVGGLLADPTAPAAALHWLVGQKSVLGGNDGVAWLMKYPYALPNVASAVFLSSSLLLCWLFLEETLPSKAGNRDLGNVTGQALVRTLRRILRWPVSTQDQYIPLMEADQAQRDSSDGLAEGARNESEDTLFEGEHGAADSARSSSLETIPDIAVKHESGRVPVMDSITSKAITALPKVRYSQVLTPNVVLTLISFMLCPLHNATSMQLLPLYLSTPPSRITASLPFRFGGGLGLSTSHVGYAMSCLGFIGVTLQILVFPRVQAKFGTMWCYRTSLWIFPVAYTLIPYLSVLPSTTKDHASGAVIWSALILLLSVQVVARTFALPTTVILLNNSAPSRECLGTIHGLGSSLASLSRVIGPLSGAFLFGLGEEIGIVGLVWWILACVAIFGAIFSMFIYEGNAATQKVTDGHGTKIT